MNLDHAVRSDCPRDEVVPPVGILKDRRVPVELRPERVNVANVGPSDEAPGRRGLVGEEAFLLLTQPGFGFCYIRF